MVILKKIKSSTILETLVASSIILAVFVIGTLSINNIFFRTVSNDAQALDARLNELEYHLIHQTISLPFYEETEHWDIHIESKSEVIELEVLNKKNKKITNKRIGV